MGLVSVWFDDPTRLTTALGLVTAGLAFALQKVVTSVAGYFVILRGQTFNVGDRITMGGVRGDVIALGFIQTTIMEMGQPPAVQNADPAMWVHSRQYTGRIVTVSNAKIFDEPVYNYTRDFPYIWEEMTLPITYTADRDRAERILLEVAGRHTVADRRDRARPRCWRWSGATSSGGPTMTPKVYFRLTDNWLELTVRFIARDHGIRELKDAMSREILAALDDAGIGIASATFEVVGLPPLRLERAPGPTAGVDRADRVPRRSRTVERAGDSTKRTPGRHHADLRPDRDPDRPGGAFQLHQPQGAEAPRRDRVDGPDAALLRGGVRGRPASCRPSRPGRPAARSIRLQRGPPARDARLPALRRGAPRRPRRPRPAPLADRDPGHARASCSRPRSSAGSRGGCWL